MVNIEPGLRTYQLRHVIPASRRRTIGTRITIDQSRMAGDARRGKHFKRLMKVSFALLSVGILCVLAGTFMSVYVEEAWIMKPFITFGILLNICGVALIMHSKAKYFDGNGGGRQVATTEFDRTIGIFSMSAAQLHTPEFTLPPYTAQGPDVVTPPPQYSQRKPNTVVTK